MELAFIKAGFVPGGKELSWPGQQSLVVWQLKALAHDMKYPHLRPPPTSPGGERWRENESVLSDRQRCTPRMRSMSWGLLQFTPPTTSSSVHTCKQRFFPSFFFFFLYLLDNTIYHLITLIPPISHFHMQSIKVETYNYLNYQLIFWDYWWFKLLDGKIFITLMPGQEIWCYSITCNTGGNWLAWLASGNNKQYKHP